MLSGSNGFLLVKGRTISYGGGGGLEGNLVPRVLSYPPWERGWVGGQSTKKYIRVRENEMKKIHARQLNLKNIHATA